MGNIAFSLFENGELKNAIDAAIDRAKNKPTDIENRFLLAELFCFAGEFERADKQVNALANQESEARQRCSLFRQLIRAEVARKMFFSEGRIPELVSDPSESIRLCLEASVAIRDDEMGKAVALLDDVDTGREKINGTSDKGAFDGIRDLDDLTSCFFEVLTSTGKYYWIPFTDMISIEFRPPETVHDLLWRSANISVNNGPNGEVYFPTRYVDSGNSTTESLQLGRERTWTDPDNGPVRGLGQRELLIGEDVVPFLEIKRIDFEQAG